jgi:signal peptidase I
MTDSEPFASRRPPDDAPWNTPQADATSVPSVVTPRSDTPDDRPDDRMVDLSEPGPEEFDDPSTDEFERSDDLGEGIYSFDDRDAGVPRPDADEDEPRRRGSWSSLLRELPVLILVAFVLAFVLRTFVVQVFYIPSSSMEPTLQVNDRILVDKVSYRFRDLQRGDIVVFEGDHIVTPDANGSVERVLRGFGQLIGVTPANARDFVKRVVGLPGDEIEITEAGEVFVNGVALEEPYLGQEDPRTCGPLVVPEGKLFFLGDNRGNSSDSRASLGYVPIDHVVGRAFVTIWPIERVHVLPRPSYAEVPAPAEAAPPADLVPTHDICNPR